MITLVIVCWYAFHGMDDVYQVAVAVCPVAEYTLFPEKLNVSNYDDAHLGVGHTIPYHFQYIA